MADKKYKLGFGRTPVEPKFWFLEAALYHAEDYRFDHYDEHGFDTYRSNLMGVIFPKITIDVYCPACKRETVFVPVFREDNWVAGPVNHKVVKGGVSYAHFRCSRQHCGSDLYFIFVLNEGVLTKIGQLPSIGDLIKPELRKYSSVLKPSELADWQRAVGLRAHGIGAGSYVYLRRIIESMLNSARDTALAEGKLAHQDFERARWPERIKLLVDYLPTYLVQNSKVYSVLSKGVHELSEEECADYFDVMHTSIEVICQEKLAAKERRDKAEAGAKALQRVLQSLGDKES